jgi:hypothetical protein
LRITQQSGPAGGVPCRALCGIFSRLFLKYEILSPPKQAASDVSMSHFWFYAGGVIIVDLSLLYRTTINFLAIVIKSQCPSVQMTDH